TGSNPVDASKSESVVVQCKVGISTRKNQAQISGFSSQPCAVLLDWARFYFMTLWYFAWNNPYMGGAPIGQTNTTVKLQNHMF
ncbi:MAG: hypothetical protein Q8L87_04480, partial [Anaerolineales bacterium]|nr:hypothetical protein [Anaerolineales bacterium]